MLYSFTILPWLTFLVLCSTTPWLSTEVDSTALISRQNSNADLAILRAQYQELDITSSGNYNMIFCDADGEGQTKARMLKALIPLIQAQLDQLLLDAKLGTRSSHGYEALFKSRRNKKIVQSVFQKIRSASFIPLGDQQAAYLGKASAAPMFVCIEPGNPKTADLLAICNSSAKPGRSKTLFVTGEAIFICPVFWGLPAGLHRDQCPTVVNNKVVGSDELVRSMWVFFSEHLLRSLERSLASIRSKTMIYGLHPLNSRRNTKDEIS